MHYFSQWHIFNGLTLSQIWTAWHGTVVAAENALMGNCCVMISGTAMMDLTNSTAVSQVIFTSVVFHNYYWFLDVIS